MRVLVIDADALRGLTPESSEVITTVILKDTDQEWSAEGVEGRVLLQDASSNFGIIGDVDQVNAMIRGIVNAIAEYQSGQIKDPV